MKKLVGAIEGGGSKFICAVGSSFDEIHDELTVETRDPEQTLAGVIAFFARHRGQFDRLGVCSFGPLELDVTQGDAYGSLLTTPKPGWTGFPLRARLRHELDVDVRIDTDVNGAALAEQRKTTGVTQLAYVTVGTGVGIGVVIDGKPVHGLMHPELGHLRVPRLAGDTFAGTCPFHGDCVEGLIAVPALRARTGREPHELADDDPVWEGVSQTLAWLMHSIVLAYSPERIVLGGGVLERKVLWPRVLERTCASLAGYVPRSLTQAEGIERYIVRPQFGLRAGLAGAFELATET